MKFLSYFFPVSENGENGIGHEVADGGNAPPHRKICGLEPSLDNRPWTRLPMLWLRGAKTLS